MEKLHSKSSNAIDLEFGDSKENRIEDQVSSIQNSGQKSSKLLVGMLNRNGLFGGMARLNSTKNNTMIYTGVDVDIVVSGAKEMVSSNSADKKSVKKGKKETGSKKHPKPPRPPKHPSLDEADMKLIREISELARLKSARNRRMKALNNLRTDKPSAASLSNLFAMMVTILFVLVIIFQGLLGSHV